MAVSQKKLLEMIADSPAMSVLDSPACAVEQGQPAKVADDGTMQEEGTPNRTLGDLIREALG
jgi:hypothetical protein